MSPFARFNCVAEPAAIGGRAQVHRKTYFAIGVNPLGPADHRFVWSDRCHRPDAGRPDETIARVAVVLGS